MDLEVGSAPLQLEKRKLRRLLEVGRALVAGFEESVVVLGEWAAIAIGNARLLRDGGAAARSWSGRCRASRRPPRGPLLRERGVEHL